MRSLPPLLECEVEALFQALRRDLRDQLERTEMDKEHGVRHALNARKVLRLLEALNPRNPE